MGAFLLAVAGHCRDLMKFNPVSSQFDIYATSPTVIYGVPVITLTTGTVMNGASANRGLYLDGSTKTAVSDNFQFNGTTATIKGVSVSSFTMTVNPSAGYIMTADANGNGTWQAASVSGSITTGTVMGGGLADSIIYLDSSAKTATSANATFNGSTMTVTRISVSTLTVTNSATVTSTVTAGAFSASTTTSTNLYATNMAGIGSPRTPGPASVGGPMLDVQTNHAPGSDLNVVMAKFTTTNSDVRTDTWWVNDSSDLLLLMLGGSGYTQTNYFSLSQARVADLISQGATGGFFVGTYNAAPFVIGTSNVERVRVLSTGSVGINTTTPGSLLHIASGTLTIGGTSAGLVIGQGNTAVNGIRRGSVSIDFGATAGGTCEVNPSTMSVTGVADGDEIALGIPTALAASDTSAHFWAYVSSTNNVTVLRCCNKLAGNCSDPAAATVKATIFR